MMIPTTSLDLQQTMERPPITLPAELITNPESISSTSMKQDENGLDGL